MTITFPDAEGRPVTVADPRRNWPNSNETNLELPDERRPTAWVISSMAARRPAGWIIGSMKV